MRLLPACLVCVLTASLPAWGQQFRPYEVRAEVSGCKSGDTVRVRVAEEDDPRQPVIEVTLEGVDAPEMDQPLGDRSEARLEMLLRSPGFLVKVLGEDEHGHSLARIEVDGVDVGEQLLADGLAWHDLTANRDARLASAQLAALTARKGIWSTPHSVPPWKWRQKNNPEPPAADAPEVTAESHGFLLQDLSLNASGKLIGQIVNSSGHLADATRFTIALYGPGGRLKDVAEISVRGQFHDQARHAFAAKVNAKSLKNLRVVFECVEGIGQGFP